MALNGKGFGLSFLDSQEDDPPPPPPPPPSLEVLPSQVSSSVKCTVEPVNLDGLTLLKGRVSTKEVFRLPNSDLVPGVYEGGLKLWEGSLDLVKALQSEIQNGHISFTGKRVLELGCGHGLPGIFAYLKGAAATHFQDFNAEVLRCLTIPNVNANISKEFQPGETKETNRDTGAEVRFFAGDWSQIHQLLPYVCHNENDLNCSSGLAPTSGYDIILMAETIYSIPAHQSLYGLIKKCLSHPQGVVYMAAKKHYFGVGGGTRRFLSMVEKDGELILPIHDHDVYVEPCHTDNCLLFLPWVDTGRDSIGIMDSCLVAEVANGSSNVREVWKLSFKE